MSHTINILNKENNEVAKSYELDFEPDTTGFTDSDELSQLEAACEKLIRNKRPNFDEIEWVAVVNDEKGEEVGRFENHYFSR